MSTLLEAEHLTKIFTQRGKESFKAVDDVSFTLKPGETLGIVGESGSGKSTLAKMITRLTDITEGTLKFEGKDITRLKHNQLKDVYGNIQMVFQNPVGSFDPRRTLGDGIGESLRNRGMKKADIEKRVAELLEQCGLSSEFAKRYPHEVSGGQCQRAAIARALAVEPKVLICDEATSALDVTIQKQIMELLEELKEKHGLSFIFICHNLALVQMFCDRVLVLYEGKVVESGLQETGGCCIFIECRKRFVWVRKDTTYLAGLFYYRKVFHKTLISCKIGMAEYPPGELVKALKSDRIILAGRQEKGRKCEFLYIVTCKTSTKFTCEIFYGKQL